VGESGSEAAPAQSDLGGSCSKVVPAWTGEWGKCAGSTLFFVSLPSVACTRSHVESMLGSVSPITATCTPSKISWFVLAGLGELVPKLIYIIHTIRLRFVGDQGRR
jgi:hypothetical protein